MATIPLATESTMTLPSAPDTRSAVIERATVREILMGAQDNLTTVLAVTLGVAIGSGRADLVALAGLSAAVAEAVSMGGVLYNSTRAEAVLDERLGTEASAVSRTTLAPVQSGIVTFVAAMLAGLIPLAPFAFLPLSAAVPVSIIVSVAAMFVVGSAIGRVSGSVWWRDGLRLLVVAGLAAVAAAAVGAMLRIE